MEPISQQPDHSQYVILSRWDTRPFQRVYGPFTRLYAAQCWAYEFLVELASLERWEIHGLRDPNFPDKDAGFPDGLPDDALRGTGTGPATA